MSNLTDEQRRRVLGRVDAWTRTNPVGPAKWVKLYLFATLLEQQEPLWQLPADPMGES